MPKYCFNCEKCGLSFEMSMSIEKYCIPDCPDCAGNTTRDYRKEDISFFGPIKTLGSLADKNDARLSRDEKTHIKKINNEYKQ